MGGIKGPKTLQTARNLGGLHNGSVEIKVHQCGEGTARATRRPRGGSLAHDNPDNHAFLLKSVAGVCFFGACALGFARANGVRSSTPAPVRGDRHVDRIHGSDPSRSDAGGSGSGSAIDDHVVREWSDPGRTHSCPCDRYASALSRRISRSAGSVDDDGDDADQLATSSTGSSKEWNRPAIQK